jgi:hypothetical protein
VTEVALDHVLIERSERIAMACDPVQKAADYVEASPCAVPNEPLLDKSRGEALDKPTVRPALETPEQPASVQVLFDFHLPVLRC